MADLTKNAQDVVEKTVDFMASTLAFREYLGKPDALNEVLETLPAEYHQFFKTRLAHYRTIYRPDKSEIKSD